ncbi:acetyl-CoA carboxylase, biotin carboxyl carrier protein [Desulfofarcimen acetoxidans DSM 771]|jgi:oxaloacetate decarboxylase alpha subunit|uniref:Acetyl-CoA carboxylase, biotin carboxyl carrier protein n=1 Tax=Desulfofarcimen acetoxidans (strain ATCC 49208 / DSM 771 / KCTC 5769 / VKM B-1644 / 5575) TaxID=485916 RepID=C8W100_DESAS|nr:acetyl-CoA carboxylase biotin carboxyl carrier protein [Desulfofarcimen acetoxidans]ACV63396.1 acetyl-CoA carboxylase, biotin carboxyl carrier protein [Desulfofarcimen acetoxidans DSM 771]
MAQKVKITDTTLRDAHQSLWATRMRTEDMLPIAEKLDSIGYHSLEVWGGATFDVAIRYLNEDPWVRLRELKKICKNTKLQMLLRGQNIVGYGNYPDDVVEAFCHKAVENGVDIMRIFDALNDIRNLAMPIKASKAAGAHIQAVVCYTVSPVHTLEHYLETAEKLTEMGADSICIKDMAGLLAPYKAYELVKAIKEKLDIPVQVHCHYVGGLAVGSYLKAAEAGADIIDTASVPLAFGSSQPPVETVVRALKDTPYDTGLSLKQLFEASQYFEELRKRLGFERGVTRINDMRVFEHQVPGGMISNLVTQLEEQKSLHRLNEVLEEIPRVRKELGYPPLVTPTSQIVGIQAVLNVLLGERYKLIPEEVRGYIQGTYGRPAAPIDEQVMKKALGDRELIACRPADLLEPKMDKMREECKGIAESEEDVLTYAMFPQVARRFFDYRKNPEKFVVPEIKTAKPAAKGVPKTIQESKEEDEPMKLQDIKEIIKLLGETDIAELTVESDGMKVAIKKAVAVSQATLLMEHLSVEAPQKELSVPVEAVDPGELVEVASPMVGTFYKAPSPDAAPYVKLGDKVEAGQILCILEAMKLFNEIKTEVAGEIYEICVENEQPVEYGQVLFKLRKAK